MRKAKLPLVVALTIIGLTASLFVLSGTHTRIVATYWRQQLAAAADRRSHRTEVQCAALNDYLRRPFERRLGCEHFFPAFPRPLPVEEATLSTYIFKLFP